MEKKSKPVFINNKKVKLKIKFMNELGVAACASVYKQNLMKSNKNITFGAISDIVFSIKK